ncbi:threonine/serine exporter family protein [Velocimicrobium porci]|uniref:Threonine/serine exporter n=1 Tax=Velocimicrobium porci TaxID=2606634 RepID=A0A6L5Y112_9FIRM|nr:threonine/serine exporter family protein [Velocimicrobium porci]MSS64805.1 threonine/serine exporter [Velocimicrobium porci]
MLEELFRGLLQCIWAFLGSLCFGIVFNIRGKNLFYSAFGGFVAWVAYLLCGIVVPEEIVQYFVASVVISIYSESMAVYRKTPVTVFIVLGMVPLVPGGSIFYTMQHLIMGEYQLSYKVGVYTFAIAGAIAMGILIASFLVQLFKFSITNINQKKHKKEEKDNGKAL